MVLFISIFLPIANFLEGGFLGKCFSLHFHKFVFYSNLFFLPFSLMMRLAFSLKHLPTIEILCKIVSSLVGDLVFEIFYFLFKLLILLGVDFYLLLQILVLLFPLGHLL